MAPPSLIKIVRLPKHGKITFANHDGVSQDLQVGDVVSNQLMSSFKYDQGDEVCFTDNSSSCEDEFLYSTMSSWVGHGKETSAEIRLTPGEGPEISIDNSLVRPPVIESMDTEKDQVVFRTTGARTQKKDSIIPKALMKPLYAATSIFILVTIGMSVSLCIIKQRKRKDDEE